MNHNPVFEKVDVESIAKFCAYQFLLYQDPITDLEKSFENQQIEAKIIYIQDTHEARYQINHNRESFYPQDLIVLHKSNYSQHTLVTDDEFGEGSHRVTVVSPFYENGEQYIAEKEVHPVEQSKKNMIELCEKYRILEKKDILNYDKLRKEYIYGKSEFSFIRHAHIYISKEYEYEAGVEILSLLKYGPLKNIDALSINYTENFTLPQKFGDFLPSSVIELNINPEPYFISDKGELVNTMTSVMPPAVKNLQHLSVSNFSIKEVPEDFSDRYPNLISAQFKFAEKGINITPITKHSKIEVLGIVHCNLLSFPKEILSMQNLRFLDISNNHIQQLPHELTWANFVSIKCQENNIDNIRNLPWQTLVYADLAGNNIHEIPENVMGYILVNETFNPKEEHIDLAKNNIAIESNQIVIKKMLEVFNAEEVNQILSLDEQKQKIARQEIVKRIEKIKELNLGSQTVKIKM
ncbi:MAG: hypothetical protein MUC49_21285 [Raineya sp.]|jgi:hypothetical protein|nr:hypothetical protein [Raineya sp.]